MYAVLEARKIPWNSLSHEEVGTELIVSAEKMILKRCFLLIECCFEVLKAWMSSGDLREEVVWVADSSRVYTVRCICPKFDLEDTAGQRTHLQKLVSASQNLQFSSEVLHCELHDAS